MTEFWERRYRRGGNSGPGSRGRLGQYKADVLHELLGVYQIRSVLDYGCGDGSQLALLNLPDYVGVDMSATAVDLCRARFAADAHKMFFTRAEWLTGPQRAYDLAMSLDVLYHLTDDGDYREYVSQLFAHARKLVVLYTLTAPPGDYAAHICYRDPLAVQVAQPTWTLCDYRPPPWPEESAAGFYIFRPKEA